MIKQDFNHDWMFRNGLDNPMTSAFVGAAAGTTPVQLPHDAMLSSGRSEGNIDESGIGYFTPENVEYEKVLTLAQEDMGKAVYLECEGVYSNAVVEVNGYVAARHRFGFTGFVVNITDCLQPGANKIKISALNGVHPNGRYYTGTGIYRDVKLMMGDSLHIAPDGVRLTALEADAEMAVIEVSADMRHCGIGHRKASFSLSLFDDAGVEAAHAQTTFNVMSHDQLPLHLKLYVPNPKRWDMDSPCLYRYEAKITEDGRTVDTASGSFGIRTLQLDPLRGLRINGKPVKLKGGCIHSDNGCLGVVSVPDAERRRVRMLKDAGYNALRTSHNPVSHAFLDACDEYGILVMAEYADAWSHSKPAFDYSMWMEDCWERDIEDMVRVAYNHPCVIMYSIGNEIIDVGHELSARWGRRYAQKLRTIDSTRYITNGINIMMANLDKIGLITGDMGYGDLAAGEINNMMAEMGQVMGAIVTHPISLAAINESCQLLDVIGYNYAAHMYELDHAADANRILLGSETNPGELDTNWNLVKKHPYVLGDFAWTCWDYLGEPGIGRIEEKQDGFNVYAPWPWLAAYCGDFDLTGYRRPVSYWREIVWGGRKEQPYIAVCRPENIDKDLYYSQWSWSDSIHSWTFPGWEGKPTIVEVYSDADEVELLINGVSQGVRKAGLENKQYVFRWQVKYMPGIVEAVARKAGAEVGRQSLRSAENAVLTLCADTELLHAGSNDLAFVEIEYRDATGTLDLSIQRTVSISVEGELTLLGSGSADPKTTESYLDAEHRIFEGRAIAVVRAGPKAGIGKVIVSDDAGKREEISLRVE